MSRQGFYRLPLASIEAVKDGSLSLFEWSLFVWCAANANYETGIVRTCAPHLAQEMGASVVTIRKALRKLRENGWIFYTTVKRGLYPIGIHDYQLPDEKRTPTADEWHLQYGKSVTLISEGPSEINLWINLWINLISEMSGSQMFLRTSQGQSGGQSKKAAKARRTTGTNVAVGPSGGQSDGASSDQSAIPVAPETPNVDIDLRQIPTHMTIESDRTGELVGRVLHGTNNMDGKIWSLYEKKYRGRTRSGILPGHSKKECTDSIARIRYMLDPMRAEGTTDEAYLKLLGDAFDIYFKQNDSFVASDGVRWNLQTFVSRLPGILEKLEGKIS